ncbi:type 1 fimbrial protein [Salmonella enterica subsp. enterica serovar Bonariensis]|nr:type 1 fimbrial protein [Salmonella enterica]EBW7040343.1 type 1 fimbrial protein [Salmonella enterica subsp. enterica serovar Bonariensis]EBY0067078.1 type 1 fimbrial protein [Salmonella enterica subsp. enterica serovar Bonariensis]EEO8062324.1 type 1 fimbrial protein [Salmonella enterica]MKI00171.1 type 1 fimbrial protein [Salmonella enterica subsp. enterica serovar Bonariensis]
MNLNFIFSSRFIVKKEYGGQGAAGALLLAGMMMSAGAMAATGDPVTGGSGTVTINVPIVTSTCSVVVPTEVNFDPISIDKIVGTSMGQEIATKAFDIIFAHCSGRNLKMTMQSPYNSETSDKSIGAFSSGGTAHSILYTIFFEQDKGITGGVYGARFNLGNDEPVMFTPDNDNYTFTPRIHLLRWVGDFSNMNAKISGSFTYNITYQ